MKPASVCFALLSMTALAAVAAPVIDNGATPAEGLVELHLSEQWRAGGEDDDIFFGSVANVRVAESGLVYVLDTQLSQVQVYESDGTWSHTMSREGDGPGETRQPGGMYIDPEGKLCLLSGMSGRIVRLNADDTPADEGKYVSEQSAQGGLVFMLGGERAADGLVLAGIRLSFGQPGQSSQMYFLSRCDVTGKEMQVLLEKPHAVNYADFKLDETDMDFVWNRWAVDGEGRVYMAPERNDYRILVHGPDGALERTITREYEAPKRDEVQRRLATQIIEGVAAYHPVPLQGLSIEDVEPDIGGMWVTSDGELWVGTGRGSKEKPDGAYAVFDVFSTDGGFVRQAAVFCDADPMKDALMPLSDGRYAVVYGALDAWLTQQAVERTEEEQEAAEETPLELVVYSVR